VLASARIVEAVRQGSGLFQHGHTYIGHPTAAAAALAVQRVIQRDNLLASVKARGEYLRGSLVDRLGGHPHVGDIRGRGLFMGIEFVADRVSKAPFDPASTLHAKVKSQAMAQGLLVYPMGGTIDGRSGDHVLIAPPFIATESDIDQIVDRLCISIDQAIASLANSRTAP
jgi:adenosylmethionine-8-amino-7-oxononanoate aminotransferase